MPQLEQIEAIEKRLWKAADTLRAKKIGIAIYMLRLIGTST
jgi:hypothetical protein